LDCDQLVCKDRNGQFNADDYPVWASVPDRDDDDGKMN
jgi:hypothetical protein